ncbi:MAG TPA: C40 family peptidase [Mycobacteriales bacterium]|nr:C40 family peptidase [Mycobacteriales bacterium]
MRPPRFIPCSDARPRALLAVAGLAVAGGLLAAVTLPGAGPSVAAASAASIGTRALTELLDSAATASGAAAAPRPARNAIVAVSAAEVWAGPHRVKPVDRPAMQSPAHLLDWLHGMSFFQRSHLYQRLATQVRYGEQVVVLARRGTLSRIRIPDQTGGRYPTGIVGWIASRQLAAEPADWGAWRREATVTARRAQLRGTAGGHLRTVALSYATTLPVIQVSGSRVVVAAAGPLRAGSLPRSAVSIHAPDTAALRPSGRQVVAQARRFLGLPYLWAGMTSWGFDCSGLASTVYSMLGIRLPRDAADQSLVGRSVPRRALRPGDLVYFSYNRKRSGIHHVAIYAGDGRVIQSPYTGARVDVMRLRGSYLNREYWGASRPLR